MTDRLKESLARYADKHIPCGGFLRAVLSNDLWAAVNRADPVSIANLREIVNYVHTNMPMDSFGSLEIVNNWESQA